MVSAYKKRQMLVAGTIGLILGIFIFIGFWVATDKIIAVIFIPITCLIGVAQAYLAPEPE